MIVDESMDIEVNINHKLAILNEFKTKKKLATVSRLPEISRLRQLQRQILTM